MRRIVLYALTLVMAAACSNSDSPQRPPISLDKVSLVIQELRIMEAAYGMHYQQIDSLKTGWKPFHLEVFKRLGVSEEDFKKSMEYYTLYPDSLLMMDSLIIHRLEPQSGERLNKGIPGQKHIPNHQPKVDQESGQ